MLRAVVGGIGDDGVGFVVVLVVGFGRAEGLEAVRVSSWLPSSMIRDVRVVIGVRAKGAALNYLASAGEQAASIGESDFKRSVLPTEGEGRAGSLQRSKRATHLPRALRTDSRIQRWWFAFVFIFRRARTPTTSGDTRRPKRHARRWKIRA